MQFPAWKYSCQAGSIASAHRMLKHAAQLQGKASACISLAFSYQLNSETGASNKAACCRDNIEDAMEKMQGALDRAAESVIPHEVDQQKVKKIAKQYDTLTSCLSASQCKVKALHMDSSCPLCKCRKRVANESRLQNKKVKSQRKSERRGKIEW